MALYHPIAIARFWSKVDVKPSADDCWLWTAGTKNKGYGRLKVEGKLITASRMAWELLHEEELGDRHALHQCDNPRCCNPHHINAGDHAENMREAKERGLINPNPLRGSENPRAKLSEDQVERIRELIEDGNTNTSIAEKFGVSHSLISRIKLGLSWAERTGGEQ